MKGRCLDRLTKGPFRSGDDLLSQGAAPQVPSAMKGLTSVFEMGTGVALSPLSPDSTAHKLRIALLHSLLIAHVPFQVRCALRNFVRLALLASCQSHIGSIFILTMKSVFTPSKPHTEDYFLYLHKP